MLIIDTMIQAATLKLPITYYPQLSLNKYISTEMKMHKI